MIQGRTPLAEVVSTVQVFRLEQKRWPAHAADLLAFSRAWGEGLDLSGFHMLVLRKEGDWTLSLEYALLPEGDQLASCGKLEVRRVGGAGQEATFQWHTRHEALPPRRVERSAYCFIG